jgi:hypothetical protein
MFGPSVVLTQVRLRLFLDFLLNLPTVRLLAKAILMLEKSLHNWPGVAWPGLEKEKQKEMMKMLLLLLLLLLLFPCEKKRQRKAKPKSIATTFCDYDYLVIVEMRMRSCWTFGSAAAAAAPVAAWELKNEEGGGGGGGVSVRTSTSEGSLWLAALWSSFLHFRTKLFWFEITLRPPPYSAPYYAWYVSTTDSKTFKI